VTGPGVTGTLTLTASLITCPAPTNSAPVRVLIRGNCPSYSTHRKEKLLIILLRSPLRTLDPMHYGVARPVSSAVPPNLTTVKYGQNLQVSIISAINRSVFPALHSLTWSGPRTKPPTSHQQTDTSISLPRLSVWTMEFLLHRS